MCVSKTKWSIIALQTTRNQILLHYKLQVHSKESNTIALQTTIVFKEIKVLLYCEMSSKKPNNIV